MFRRIPAVLKAFKAFTKVVRPKGNIASWVVEPRRTLYRSGGRPGDSLFLRPPSTVLNGELKRYKSKKPKLRAQDSDSDDSSDDESEETSTTGPADKILSCRVKSARLDSLIKAGLGISKNKVEAIFYDSKIRLNGQKIPKKSVKVVDGDEIDVVKAPCKLNPDMLTVSRIEIVKIKTNDDEDGFIVKLKRFKSLTVENYEGSNRWTVSSA